MSGFTSSTGKSLPFGTALGVYALWVLLHNESRATFHGARGTV